jgi:hypothetical protein
MNQNEIMEQAFDYIKNNLEDFNKLQLLVDILEDIILNIQYDIATDKDKKTFNTLTSIQLQLKEIIKENQ